MLHIKIRWNSHLFDTDLILQTCKIRSWWFSGYCSDLFTIWMTRCKTVFNPGLFVGWELGANRPADELYKRSVFCVAGHCPEVCMQISKALDLSLWHGCLISEDVIHSHILTESQCCILQTHLFLASPKQDRAASGECWCLREDFHVLECLLSFSWGSMSYLTILFETSPWRFRHLQNNLASTGSK